MPVATRVARAEAPRGGVPLVGTLARRFLRTVAFVLHVRMGRVTAMPQQRAHVTILDIPTYERGEPLELVSEIARETGVPEAEIERLIEHEEVDGVFAGEWLARPSSVRAHLTANAR